MRSNCQDRSPGFLVLKPLTKHLLIVVCSVLVISCEKHSSPNPRSLGLSRGISSTLTCTESLSLRDKSPSFDVVGGTVTVPLVIVAAEPPQDR